MRVMCTDQYSILIRGEKSRVFNIFTFVPFVAQPADRRKKYLQNRCPYVRRIYTQKN